jgi:hypothetical protein
VDPKCYSEEVHRTLADEGLAPLLLGTAHVAGAPSAIAMEYLDPASGWVTLQNYVREHRETKINTERPTLVKLLKTMKEKKVVHGGLRPNNIMCRAPPDRRTEGQELEIKVVDFDWAGKLGSAKRPAIMNPDVEWPGAPRDVIGGHGDETLLMKTLACQFHFWSPAFPPGPLVPHLLADYNAHLVQGATGHLTLMPNELISLEHRVSS